MQLSKLPCYDSDERKQTVDVIYFFHLKIYGTQLITWRLRAGELVWRKRTHGANPTFWSLTGRGKSSHVLKVAVKMVGIILTGWKRLLSNLFLDYVKYLGQESFSKLRLDRLHVTHHSPGHFQTESMSILSNICFVNHHREAETFWVYVMLFVWLGVAVCRCEVKTVGLIPLSTPQGAWALLFFPFGGLSYGLVNIQRLEEGHSVYCLKNKQVLAYSKQMSINSSLIYTIWPPHSSFSSSHVFSMSFSSSLPY